MIKTDWQPCPGAQAVGQHADDRCSDCVAMNAKDANAPDEEKAKEVFYVAHPVSGDIQANIDNVVAWIKWLTLNDPSRVYVAPWVAEVMAFKDMGELDPAFYDRVLQDDVTVLRKLDGILMVGGKISRGMGIERDGMRPGMTLQDWSYARTPADLRPEHIEALGCQ